MADHGSNDSQTWGLPELSHPILLTCRTRRIDQWRRYFLAEVRARVVQVVGRADQWAFLVRQIPRDLDAVIGQDGSLCLTTPFLIEHAERLNLLHLLRHALSESPAKFSFRPGSEIPWTTPSKRPQAFSSTLPPFVTSITTFPPIPRLPSRLHHLLIL